MNTTSLVFNGAQFGQVCDTLSDEWGDENEVEPLRFSEPKSYGDIKKAVDSAIKPRITTDNEIHGLQGAARRYVDSATGRDFTFLQHRAAVRLRLTPSPGPVSKRIASINLNTDSVETVARQVLSALTSGEAGESVEEVLKALRDKMPKKAAEDFSKTGEIARKVAEALWDVYTFNRDERDDFIRTNIKENPARNIFFLTELLFYADASWQRLPTRNEIVRLVSLPSFDFQARHALIRPYSPDLIDYTHMMIAVHHELVALQIRNRLISYEQDGYWPCQPGEKPKKGDALAKVVSEMIVQLKIEFKEASRHYFLAGNLPAAKRCYHFILSHQNDFPADLDAEILKACAGLSDMTGRRMLRQALAVYVP